MDPQWITLDVGGRLFKTFKSTLLSDSRCIFARMLQDEGEWAPTRNESGHVVIDADPDAFAVVLNFMRYNEVIIPPKVARQAVWATANYLQINGVIDWFNRDRKQLLFAWGSGQSGELGTWSREDVATPVSVKVVPYGSKVVQVALGAQYSCVLTDTGVVYTFGNGEWGQLGVSTPDSVSTPVPVEGLLHSKVVCIATGYAYAMAVTGDHKVYFWGNNNHGQSGLGPRYFGASYRKIEEPTVIDLLQDVKICQISCGSFFVLALDTEGSVWSWGLIDCLGLGTVDEVKHRFPDEVSDSVSKDKRAVLLSPHPIETLSGHEVTRIAAGQWHSCAITREGRVHSWGVGFQGRLGHGNKEPCPCPQLVKGNLEEYVVVDVSCGSFHTVALTSCGKVFCWGDNANGQCGVTGMEAVTQPVQVHSLTLLGGGIARSISSGRQHTSVVIGGPHTHEIPDAPDIIDHGQVFFFGDSKTNVQQGQPVPRGGSSSTGSCSSGAGSSPPAGGPSMLASSSCHYRHSPHLPRLVPGMELSNVRSVTSGLYHSIALSEAIVSHTQ
eukprot:TRINITY_DN27942_c0_g1_i1.p1 TRINITY_DN27942_c0_g1~~TRINITY_DN27942_c0_g1_i1.p1  ORF type:complete len:553 (+),score=140.20 TRINITY_DN27942_c0_g1_i1:182-1840(+)